MTRLHADPVEVQRQHRDDRAGPVPVARPALRRARGARPLDRVRRLVAQRRGPALSRTATADRRPAGPARDRPDPVLAQVGAAGLGRAGARRRRGRRPGGDRRRRADWWRVEAGAGRAAGTGVYDLCFDWSTGSWSLARVLD